MDISYDILMPCPLNKILRDLISIGIQKDVRCNIPTCSNPSSRRIMLGSETNFVPQNNQIPKLSSGWETQFVAPTGSPEFLRKTCQGGHRFLRLHSPTQMECTSATCHLGRGAVAGMSCWKMDWKVFGFWGTGTNQHFYQPPIASVCISDLMTFLCRIPTYSIL